MDDVHHHSDLALYSLPSVIARHVYENHPDITETTPGLRSNRYHKKEVGLFVLQTGSFDPRGGGGGENEDEW